MSLSAVDRKSPKERYFVILILGLNLKF